MPSIPVMSGASTSGTPFEVRTTTWACAVCGADDGRPYRSRMYAIGERTFDLTRCRRCGLVYCNPRPDEGTLGRMYDDEEYYTHGYNLGVEDQNYFERRDELVAEAEEEWAVIESEVGGRGAALELGSAGGFFLEGARRRGWQVAGVELSPPAAGYSREELGLEVFEGWLADAPYEPGRFDVAVADNVLEHTTDPRETLRQLRELVRPGGHVLVVVPSYVNSGIFRMLLAARRVLPRRLLGPELCSMLKFGDGDGGFPYHILEFDRPTLVRLVESAGLEVVSVEGSVPRPAHLFKREDLSTSERFLRTVFVVLDRLMKLRLAPAASLRLLAKRPVS